MDLQTQIKAKEAISFLQSHPALALEYGDSLSNGLWYMMSICCKHGHSEPVGAHGVRIYNDNPNWSLYSDLLTEEEKNDPLNNSVDVPYERVYGELWAPDHIEFWYEITFFVFEGDPYAIKDLYDPKKWGRYGGPEGGANSFEEMVIKAAEEVKKAYGDFNTYESFHTADEKENNEKEDILTPIESEKPGLKSFIFNDNYLRTYPSLINTRWLEWYMGTEHSEGWKSEYKKWKKIIKKAKKREAVVKAEVKQRITPQQ